MNKNKKKSDISMSLLEVKNLVVEFPGRRGTLRALDDISFSIAPGEILGVVGAVSYTHLTLPTTPYV